jgi:predicted permease
MIYAVLLAILITAWDIELPVPIARTVELASNGTITLMLIMLGVQLTHVEYCV